MRDGFTTHKLQNCPQKIGQGFCSLIHNKKIAHKVLQQNWFMN